MNSNSLVTIDMTSVDYADLLDLLRTCADVTDGLVSDGHSEVADLASDFRFFVELLVSNRR